MTLTPEWRLLQKSRSGDKDAFGRLYDRHGPRVFQLLRRLTGSASSAEDLTQETFLTAWKTLGRWEGHGAFSTWLCGIALNHSRTHRRSQKDADLLDETVEPAALDADPLLHLTRREAERVLEEAISSLPDTCREAFVLVRVEGLRYQEAAALLGVPLGTVQSRIHRATALLKAQLTDCPQKGTPHVV